MYRVAIVGVGAIANVIAKALSEIPTAKLVAGSCVPSPVRRVDIEKPQGGTRALGIPTLTDRLIQQALHQVSTGRFEHLSHFQDHHFRWK